MFLHRSAIVLSLLTAASSVVAAQSLTARLDSTMRVAERAGFSGVVRVERAGVTLLEQAYGLANRAENTSFTPATVVQIGSNTKDFTAVAILQLQQAGKLSVNDSLGRYFAAAADKRNITIRQLMNHRAGFPQRIGGDFEEADVSRVARAPLRPERTNWSRGFGRRLLLSLRPVPPGAHGDHHRLDERSIGRAADTA